MKQVTVCIPLYNAETTITRTLESLIAQVYPIYKIKIFDNLSTDNGRNIVKDFQKKHPFIELIINEVNLGAEGNFTKCLTAAEGEYCLIAHSDDIYQPNFLLDSIKTLENNPDCIASFTNALEINDKEEIIGSRFFPNELANREVSILTETKLLELVFKYSNFITCPSVVARSDIYREKIKTWNGETFKTSADLDVWLRLVKFGNMAAINKTLINYRVADASLSYRIAKKRITKHDLFLVLDQYQNNISKDDYNFLSLKDQAIRSLNIYRNNLKVEKFPEEVPFSLSLVINKMLQSNWHFKFGIAIIGINVLVNFLKLIGWNKNV